VDEQEYEVEPGGAGEQLEVVVDGGKDLKKELKVNPCTSIIPNNGDPNNVTPIIIADQVNIVFVFINQNRA
jgi:hypothetical protein